MTAPAFSQAWIKAEPANSKLGLGKVRLDYDLGEPEVYVCECVVVPSIETFLPSKSIGVSSSQAVVEWGSYRL